MKNNFLKFLFIIIISTFVLISYFSIIGIETDKFNQQIKKKIIQYNKNFDLDLKKVKFLLDPIEFKIYAKTIGATVFISKRQLPLEYIKSEISLNSLIKNKIISSNVQVATRSIILSDLVKFIRTINNKPELFLLEKTIKKGHVIFDVNLNFDDNGKIENDYQIKGLIKKAKINILNQIEFDDINLNFNIRQDAFLLNDIKFQSKKINFISEEFKIKKIKNDFLIDGTIKNDKTSLNNKILDLLNIKYKNINIEKTKFTSNNKLSLKINNRFKIQNIDINSNININELKFKIPSIVQNNFSDINEYVLLKNQKLNLIYNNKNISLKGEGQIILKDNEDQINYLINKNNKDLIVETELFLKDVNLKKRDLLQIYFPRINEKINFKDQKIKIEHKNKNLSISGSGKIKIEKNFEDIEYFLIKNTNNVGFNTKLNLKNTKFKIDDINYEKKNKTSLLLNIEGNIKNNNNLYIENLLISEKNNKIKIINLYLNNLNQIIKVDQANFEYIDIENKKNIFSIKNITDSKYKIEGTKFNANTLISNLLKNKKEIKIFEKNFNLDLDFNEVFIDQIYLVKDLKGNLKIKDNKVFEADLYGYFDDSKNINFTVSTNEYGEKITNLFSSKAKPLVNRYKFVKGFEDGKEGYLNFSSSKINGISNSKLVIDNFKVKEIPALAKLLALASLQGIADLLTGEGIRFTDFEMKFSNENDLMKIQELYAIGPAISILLEGYIEVGKLISLRGTLVPATTINRSIASIPILGDLLIGKKVGEGIFGVSFKVKGPPKNLETTVNPIKTLTPRFITRTLEKIKKN